MNENKIFMYVGTYTNDEPSNNGIHVFAFDSRTGQLTKTGESEKVNNPSYLVTSNDLLYAVMEDASGIGPDTGGIACYKIDSQNGGVTLINSKIINNRGACHLAISNDRRYLAAANYKDGSVSLLSVNADGSINATADIVSLSGKTGPNTERQNAPHAHYVMFRGSEVFVTDLGLDKVFCFNIQEGKLKTNEKRSFMTGPGKGPRHMEQNGPYVYVLNELSSDVSVFYDNQDSGFTEIQTISALPGNFNGENTAAAIHFSTDKRLLYCSNRGHDSIAIFDVNAKTGFLSLKTILPSDGNGPRDFSISPCGKFLIAAHQYSNSLVVFKMKEDGTFERTGLSYALSRPVCIKFSCKKPHEFIY